MGEACDKSFTEELKKIADKSAGFNVHVHHLHSHNYGNHKEITFHIYLPENMTVKEAHSIADNIEKDLKKQLSITATVHIDAK